VPFSDDFITHKRRLASPFIVTTPITATDLFDWGGTAYNTLEFTRPHSTMDANDRWTAAYPGLPYEVRCGVIGGVYPYQYALVNAPSGMTIDENTGKITWSSPSAGTYSNIQVTVTDTKGTTVTSAAWSITCATTRFRFFDAVNGNNSWDGTSPTFVSGTTGPKQTMSAFWGIGSHTIIGYFLTGTYTNSGMTVQSEGIRWGTFGNRPTIWLAYPNNTPVMDFEHDEGVVEAAQWDFLNNSGTNKIYIDSFELTRSGNKMMRFGSLNNNIVVWRCHIHHWGPGADSANSAVFDYESGGYSSGDTENSLYQDNYFHDIVQPTVGTEPNCVWKLYVMYKPLFENNLFDGLHIGGEDEEVIANKAGNRRITVRGNTATNMGMGVFGGNMNAAINGYNCDFEFCFNNVHNTSSKCVLINHDHTQNEPSYLYRNTFRGSVIWDELQSANGPYTYFRNVTINGNAGTDNPDGSGITHNIAPQDISRLTASDTLFGASGDGIVDSNGLLQGSYRTNYLYFRGHEVPTL
jgi:hypothetical protein